MHLMLYSLSMRETLRWKLLHDISRSYSIAELLTAYGRHEIDSLQTASLAADKAGRSPAHQIAGLDELFAWCAIQQLCNPGEQGLGMLVRMASELSERFACTPDMLSQWLTTDLNDSVAIRTCIIAIQRWAAERIVELRLREERQDLTLDQVAAANASKGSDGTKNQHGPGAQELGVSKEPTKRKRSTDAGEANDKLLAALTAHHEYDNGICGNEVSIGCNELARRAAVAPGSASAFFAKKFGGHKKYQATCIRNPQAVAKVLKALNGEYSIDDTYGDRPAGEEEREDDQEP
jgi:hypothetical protein